MKDARIGACRDGPAPMSVPLSEGDRLPELALRDSSGSEVSLRALGGEETLILFLRHLA